MAQWPGAVAALAEDPGPVPRAPHAQGVCIYMQVNIHVWLVLVS